MATSTEALKINMPELPAKHDEFISYVATHSDMPVWELVEPYKQYDAEMRKVFAQKPDHPAAATPNIVPIFNGRDEKHMTVRARDVEVESRKVRECYIMPLKDEDRRADGSPAIVQSLKDFRTSFNVFSESSLVDLDWSNVVVAGSAVVTSLLAVPDKHAGSKRALRDYYHEQLAPASDVDLFIYGLTEEQAKEKIKQIEQSIRNAILAETTTVRTKNAITIASQYPTRHVQIVLRIYKSISEILTGFDVDCSCAAYDGNQVWASPRALAAYVTQTNTIDLTRRSPSYESRLSKYAHRGFEVYWPDLNRSRIDPTIFERSFGRTEGLARLLILEKLPKSQDRDAYLDQRRAERGRPAINRWRMSRSMIRDNIKNDYEDEVAEWVDAEAVSDYHTFTIPYGPHFHARKIEKLLYTMDLLMNAEWNLPKDREVNLHRHPAFFGRAEDVFNDCCGSCPNPKTVEEEEVSEEESKVYISGVIQFIKDNPGRQTIGSFNPLTSEAWTDMAYVGNTEGLCKAIVDGDSEYVKSWLKQEGNDPNTRDFTGRTPLHLAAANSTPGIVQSLIDHGARLVARLVDGKTALHLAAMRGSVEIVSALLQRSEANEEQEEAKHEARRAARAAAKDGKPLHSAMRETKPSESEAPASDGNESDMSVDIVDTDGEDDEDEDEDEDLDATTENSMVNIKSPAPEADDVALEGNESDDGPDVYDVNVVAWDAAVSPLHLAIINGHCDVVKTLVEEFGADVLLPIKLITDDGSFARVAILTLVLALQLPTEKAQEMTRTLIQLGASSAQADMDQNTALHYCVADFPDMLDTLVDADKTGTGRALNHLSASGHWQPVQFQSPFLTAIKAKDSLTALRLLADGAKPLIDFSSYIKAYQTKAEPSKDSKRNKTDFENTVEQPVVTAVQCELPGLAKTLVEQHGVDPNTLTVSGWRAVHYEHMRTHLQGKSLIDAVRWKIENLKRWEHKRNNYDPPIPLQDESTYFQGLKEGSYAWWSAQKQLDQAKDRYKRELEAYEDNVKHAQDDTGVAEKQAAIDAMLNVFESLEALLLEKGGKPFCELYPDVEDSYVRPNPPVHFYEPPKPKPFVVDYTFRIPDLTEEKQTRYMELFEAVWKADLQAVKELTLIPWSSSDSLDQPPLKIAVQDQHDLSPFAIAVLQNHYELATAIMEIARAQYVPSDEPHKERFRLDGGRETEPSNAGTSDEIRIYSEVVDEQFTVETIGEVSTHVKSRTTPFAMMLWNCPASNFQVGSASPSPQGSNSHSYLGPRQQHSMAGKRTNAESVKASINGLSDQKSKQVGPPRNLIQFALHNDKQDLLRYLLALEQDYTRAGIQLSDDDAIRYCDVHEADYLEAIKLDRPHLTAELIKRTGAGIPFNKLIKHAGIESKEKPKYYQGLSVYGKKRKDWADAGRGENFQPVENHRPGLLEAAREGSLETVKWFLSDGPMRSYQQFAESSENDQRIKSLFDVKVFEAALARFLSARSRLAIHCSIIGNAVPEAKELLRFLIKSMPDAIDAKNSEGITPLAVAFRQYDDEAAKILIEAGADQTCRDKQGNNIIHNLFKGTLDTEKTVQQLPKMLELVDKRVLPTLFIERSSEHPGSLTPLAQWIRRGWRGSCADSLLRIMLKYSKGEELNVINGEGHTPLHVAIQYDQPGFSRIILEHDATLLLRENATGRTPYEMVVDAAIAPYISSPPPLPGTPGHFMLKARRWGIRPDWYLDLAAQRPKGFVQEISEDRRSERERVWDLVKETKEKLETQGLVKRRLVSLNEANEVARRLAANQSAQRTPKRSKYDEDAGGVEEEDSQQGADEVQLWLPHAKSHVSD